jgi:glycosyltransferase involved in cell wall biosynthesis
MPSVSVIIGTYNCAEYLPGLWACLDAQTFRDFEVVVVDDASTDGETLRALEAKGADIRLIRRTVNSQTCELPRYQGVKEARAPLCAFLDADDRWDPAFLEKAVAHLRAHPSEALVHAYARVIDGADRVQRIRHEGAIPTGAAVARALLEHCFITISAVVARRERWLEALPEAEITDFGMDQDFFLAIARRHAIGFLPEVLASYRRSGSSVSVKKWKRAPRNVNTLERLWRKRLHVGLATDEEMRAILRVAYREDAEFWRHEGHPERALWFCAQGLRRFPFDAALLASGAKVVVRRFKDHGMRGS